MSLMSAGLMRNLFIVVIGVAVVGVVVYLARKRLRRKKWHDLAGHLHFRFMDEDGKGPDGKLCATEEDLALVKSLSFKCLSGGYHLNVLIGEAQQKSVVLADYVEESSPTIHSRTRRSYRTVCAVVDKELDLPSCHVSSSGRILEAVNRMAGGQDVNFGDDPTFSKAFLVEGQDEDAIRSFLSQRLRNRFVALARTSVDFESRGSTFAFHYGKLIRPSNAEAMIKVAFDFLALLKKA
ncbi:hypothetical protein LCGC14_1861320 [marine sediment metagenome]|uniref:DUF3137 domain-containing protein n=1 Tax=marine sediment metagenome TaxID=412755 RepID=A0A0F9GVW4_9ZZZZ